MTEKAKFVVPTDAHWYLPTGQPFHKVPYADPKRKGMRDVTLRDARKAGAARSVTSVQSQLSKPALNAWSLNQLLEACRTILPPLDDDRTPEAVELWLREIVAEAGKARQMAAQRGKELHAAIEALIKRQDVPTKWVDHVSAVYWKLLNDHDINLLAEGAKSELCFYNSTGYGGTIDYVLPSKDRAIFLDFKTRDEFFIVKGKLSEKLAYTDKAMQLAAYRRACQPFIAGADKGRCINVFIDMKANVHVHEWDEETLQHEEEKFRLLLAFVMANDKHYPTEEIYTTRFA